MFNWRRFSCFRLSPPRIFLEKPFRNHCSNVYTAQSFLLNPKQQAADGGNFCLSVSDLTAIFQVDQHQLVPKCLHAGYYWSKADGGGGDRGCHKTCKAPSQIISINKPTKTQLFTGWMSFLLPNQQCRGTEG